VKLQPDNPMRCRSVSLSCKGKINHLIRLPAKDRLSRHPGAASSTPDPAVADCAELALEAINKVDLMRLHAMFEHIPPSVAIQRMRELGRNLGGVALVPHDEVEFGEARRPDHVAGA